MKLTVDERGKPIQLARTWDRWHATAATGACRGRGHRIHPDPPPAFRTRRWDALQSCGRRHRTPRSTRCLWGNGDCAQTARNNKTRRRLVMSSPHFGSQQRTFAKSPLKVEARRLTPRPGNLAEGLYLSPGHRLHVQRVQVVQKRVPFARLGDVRPSSEHK